MKYQPKHFSEENGGMPDNYDVNSPDSHRSDHAHRVEGTAVDLPGADKSGDKDLHVNDTRDAGTRVNGTRVNDTRVHPSGIPVPDPGSTAEYVPMPGDNRTVIAPNGAIIRNPWSEQTEIEPDNEYTPDQEDLNLIQL